MGSLYDGVLDSRGVRVFRHCFLAYRFGFRCLLGHVCPLQCPHHLACFQSWRSPSCSAFLHHPACCCSLFIASSSALKIPPGARQFCWLRWCCGRGCENMGSFVCMMFWGTETALWDMENAIWFWIDAWLTGCIGILVLSLDPWSATKMNHSSRTGKYFWPRNFLAGSSYSRYSLSRK